MIRFNQRFFFAISISIFSRVLTTLLIFQQTIFYRIFYFFKMNFLLLFNNLISTINVYVATQSYAMIVKKTKKSKKDFVKKIQLFVTKTKKKEMKNMKNVKRAVAKQIVYSKLLLFLIQKEISEHTKSTFQITIMILF